MHGFFPDTIWLHEQNNALRLERKDPNILHPDDTVYVPDKRVKTEAKPTGARHRFRRLGVPETLRILFCDEYDEPRANIPYRIDIDGVLRHGITDGTGLLKEIISPNAALGVVYLGETDEEKYGLQLGELSPITTTEGVQGRLKNQGFYQDAINGKLDEETRAAIGSFQDYYELDISEEPDQVTLDALERLDHS
jgi:N-acetylmuramoyl-L-alanine amidase|tara:strand:- start:199 stop:780 length:582 start_codon:yes stop_codon:yes gene_type:complete